MNNHDIHSLFEIFKQKCQTHHLKITPQRTIIFNALIKAKDHPSADELYKRVKKSLPHISFDTVYRTVLTFSKVGIVNIVEGYGDAKRFDSNFQNHHHFRCLHCNAIIDFYDKTYDDIPITKEFKKEFTVLNKKVVLEGYCSDCKAKYK